jgi:radical SAM superfamily enzyme YgiQ (UPF0313 family)
MCSYCASSKVFGKFRRRNSDEIIEEIKSLKIKGWKGKPLMFVDDEMFAPRDEAIKFFNKLEKLKITWIAQATMTALFDKELMKAAAQSGCSGLIVGIESLNPETYKYVKKYQNFKNKIKETVEYVNSLGINVGGMMILGLDTDNPDRFEKDIEELKKVGIGLINFSLLRAYPATSLYSDLLKEGRVTEQWWLKDIHYKNAFNKIVPDYLKINFTPKYCSPGEMQLKALRLWRKANSFFSYFNLKNISKVIYRIDKYVLVRYLLTMLVLNVHSMILIRKLKKVVQHQQ